MFDINLLPWRENKRKKQKKIFFTYFGGFIALTIIVLIVVHFSYSNVISNQMRRNFFLQTEAENADKDIAALQKSATDYINLTNKLQAMEKLYNNRHELMRFINGIVEVLPKDIQLTEVTYSCKGIELIGLASSHEAISKFMENIEDSDFLEKPVLNELKGGGDKNVQTGKLNNGFDIKTALKGMSC